MSEWVRRGECNGCGDCCRSIQHQAIVRDPAAAGFDRAYYDARGFQPVVLDGVAKLVLMAQLVAPCPQLDAENRCVIYAGRPRTCADFPTRPVAVVGTPCSYWFEKGPARIGGLASPYPSGLDDLLREEAA